MKKRGVSLKLAGLLVGIITSSIVFSQKGIEDGSRYGQGEDSIRCLRNLSLFRDYVKHKDFEMAIQFWRIPFRECPISSKNIYIDGVKIMKYFIKESSDKAVKSAYIDTLMMVYDQRIKYYPKDKGDQRGRQGVDLLRYRRNEGIEFIKQGYEYLVESISLRKNRTSNAVLATFFSASLVLFQNQEIDNVQLVKDYYTSSNILNEKLSKRPSPTVKRIIEKQTENFMSIEIGSCDDIVAIFQTYFEDNPEDLFNLETITSVLKKNGCTNTDLFFTASIKYYELSPTAKAAANIGSMALDQNKHDEAIKYFKEAIQLETDETMQAEYYLGLALAQRQKEKFTEARNNALKAASLKSNWGEPYILIGQMYAESNGICENIELPRSIYWVAVDNFIKAKTIDPEVEEKANKLILTYSKVFPDKESAFFHGVHEGNTVNVGCWINEQTKARFN